MEIGIFSIVAVKILHLIFNILH